MGRDYTVEISQLQSQISQMTSEKGAIHEKINILEANKKIIDEANSKVTELYKDSFNAIKNDSKDDFKGSRREDFNTKITDLHSETEKWLNASKGNATLIEQTISSLKTEAANLTVGINFADRTLSSYRSLQAQNNK